MSHTMSHSQKLEGKVAIVTGGASGIGEATVRLFDAHGARMVVIGDVQDSLGQRVAESIGARKCVYVHCDVTNEDQVKNLIESTVANYGRLDIMFGNAGIGSSTKQIIVDLNLSAFDRVYAINARGMAACVKHAARAMIEKGIRGSIVCTASIAASAGGALTDYIMSKHAVLGLVRCASIQLGVHGIRVNCVSPAPLVTKLCCDTFHMEDSDVEKFFEEGAQLKGCPLTARHVADAVLFLASDDSQVITGHDLAVDGGTLVKKF